MHVNAVLFTIMCSTIKDTVLYDPDVAQHLLPHKHSRTHTGTGTCVQCTCTWVHVYMYIRTVRSFHIAVLNTRRGDEFYGSVHAKYSIANGNRQLDFFLTLSISPAPLKSKGKLWSKAKRGKISSHFCRAILKVLPIVTYLFKHKNKIGFVYTTLKMG